MSRILSDLLFFFLGQRQQIWSAWAESELAVKPKCARFDRFFILMAELVRVDGDALHTSKLMEKVDHFGINPGRFAVAISVKGIETNLHPLKQRDTFDVVDRHAILQRKTGMIGAQWKTAIWRKPPKKNLYATARIRLIALVGISARGAIELPISNGNCIATHIEDLLGFFG